MAIIIKTSEQIEKMRTAGRLAAAVLDMIAPWVQEGITTGELDRICHDYMVNTQGTVPAPLNYGALPGRPGFPRSICTSLNEVVCHGIPSESKKLKKGDILNIDVTVIKDGYHGDTSAMFCIGEVEEHKKRLVDVTRECLFLGIGQVRPGARLGDVGAVIAQHAHKNYYSVVEDFCGHGIGQGFHEDPQVVHTGKAGTGVELKEGMTFTIEPMINQGKKNTRIKKDGWTAVTVDKRLSAQWEHTLLVTRDGCEILTRRDGETAPQLG